MVNALLFPGQGSQSVGMGRKLLEKYAEAREVFQKARTVLQEDSLANLCREGPDEKLRLTLNAQPAIFLVSMAAYAVFCHHTGLSVEYVAGHSVGEYGALAAAEVFSFEEGLLLVKKRGEIMYQAGLNHPGTMTAILGLDKEILEQICKEASSIGIVEIANINSPIQAVISGEPAGVRRAEELAIEKKAKRVIPLSVSGAFHSKLMHEPALLFSKELDEIHFRDPKFPIVVNITGEILVKGSEIREALKKQMCEKVLWEESIRTLVHQGVDTFIEMEPGNVLSGLVKSINKTVKITNLESCLSNLDFEKKRATANASEPTFPGL